MIYSLQRLCGMQFLQCSPALASQRLHLASSGDAVTIGMHATHERRGHNCLRYRQVSREKNAFNRPVQAANVNMICSYSLAMSYMVCDSMHTHLAHVDLHIVHNRHTG